MEHHSNPETSLEQHFVEHTETKEMIDIKSPLYETVEDAMRLGLYRHYKSSPEALRYYVVMKVVVNVETNERLVIYRPDESPEDEIYARPLEMFNGNVQYGKGEIPRFRYAGADR